uniref:Uncharacterized protein n=1 Tax=Siphoviridae sp. ctOCb13 TaxID=2825477 RepID=A0A8S5Q239_9CAUD|nr:MAG TPA: hypothetical protein [Siphoviridae sp. ctOCb13]
MTALSSTSTTLSGYPLQKRREVDIDKDRCNQTIAAVFEIAERTRHASLRYII